MVWEERTLVSFLIRQTLRHCLRMHWKKRRKSKKEEDVKIIERVIRSLGI